MPFRKADLHDYKPPTRERLTISEVEELYLGCLSSSQQRAPEFLCVVLNWSPEETEAWIDFLGYGYEGERNIDTEVMLLQSVGARAAQHWERMIAQDRTGDDWFPMRIDSQEAVQLYRHR